MKNLFGLNVKKALLSCINISEDKAVSADFAEAF